MLGVIGKGGKRSLFSKLPKRSFENTNQALLLGESYSKTFLSVGVGCNGVKKPTVKDAITGQNNKDLKIDNIVLNSLIVSILALKVV